MLVKPMLHYEHLL